MNSALRRMQLLAVLLAALLAVGCAPSPLLSVHPLYTATDVTAEPPLSGTWSGCSNPFPLPRTTATRPPWLRAPSAWVFVKRPDNAYNLTVTIEDGTFRLRAHLVRLDRYRFMNLLPDDANVQAYGLYMPLNLILRVWIDRDAMQLAWLSDKTDVSGMALLYYGFQPVLTAPPQDLQRFFLQQVQNPEAFERVCFLLRQVE